VPFKTPLGPRTPLDPMTHSGLTLAPAPAQCVHPRGAQRQKETQSPQPRPIVPLVRFLFSQRTSAHLSSSILTRLDDGKLYATSSGDYMYIQCCADRRNGRLLGADTVADFGACMDLCMQDKTGECRRFVALTSSQRTQMLTASSVTFAPSSTGRTDSVNCALWAHGGFSPDQTSANLGHHAYYVEAPYVDQPDDEIELCSTKCPGAHNQVFTSQYGEV
jgi:hypothetical protein